MNSIFVVIFIVCNAFLLAHAPNDFLAALLDGTSKSASLCLSLVASYAVWLGLMQVWEDSGVTNVAAKALKPLCKRLFKTDDEQTLRAVSMNLSVNLLGVSGAATPYGIQAAKLLDKSDDAEYASAMLFILNATSIQLIPTSIIGIRVALGSVAPTDILLPTLFTTAFSTLIGVVLTRLFIPPKPRAFAVKNKRTRGVCTR